MKEVDLLFIGPESEIGMLSQVAKDFGYTFESISDLDKILETEIDAGLILISTLDAETTIDEMVQLTRQQFQKGYLILFIDKELSKERFQFVTKQGAQVIMLKTEMQSSKVIYAINQVLKANYIPFKAADLISDQTVPFTIYHLMPQRQRFLPIIRENDEVNDVRLKRFSDNPEFYFHRSQIDQYKKYIENNTDKSAKGLATRCRANFTALQVEFTRLCFEVSDQSNKVSLGDGQALLARCQQLCSDMLMNLAEFPDAWQIINNSSVGEFGSLERAPAIAAFCGMFSLDADFDKIEDMMLFSLLVDLGLLRLAETITKKIRESKKLTSEEQQELQRVPHISLDMMLYRKIAMNEKQRSIILSVYEKADGTGYPLGITDAKLTLEAQMIRLAKEFDALTVLKLGQAKIKPQVALRKILTDPAYKGVFSEEFKKIIEKKVLTQPKFQLNEEY